MQASPDKPMFPLAAASQVQYVDLVVDEARGMLYGADKAGNKIDVINMSDLSVASSLVLVEVRCPPESTPQPGWK